MKCAKDIVAIKAIAENEYLKEQRALDEQCKQAYASIITKTIRFCDEVVDKMLTDKAEDRRRLEITFDVSKPSRDRLGHNLIGYIRPDGKYANGDPAFAYSSDWYYLDLNVMCDYLKKHCYSVSVKESEVRIYGSGLCNCLSIEVSVPKNLPCN